MANESIPNPYEYELPKEEFCLSRGAAWWLTAIFALILALPPLWQDVRELSREDGQGRVQALRFIDAVQGKDFAGQPIAKRLKAFENQLEDQLDVAKPARQIAQNVLLTGLNLGNEKTVPGLNGWLYYRPEIKALTSFGSLHPEPTSVAKDPEMGDWQPPAPKIVEFGRQLKERGIHLWLVPLPMKESIYPEHLSGHVHERPVVHGDEAKFFEALEKEGSVKVVPLNDLFWDLKKTDAADGPVYLKQDTHWTPRAMEATAKYIAAKVRGRGILGDTTKKFTRQPHVRNGLGDLVEKLDLPTSQSFYQPETVNLQVVMDESTNQKVKSDSAAAISILGDSFVNIYHDPGLGFADNDGLIHAGFAQHLMAELGHSVDVIAKNGGAATTVREEFAKRPDDVVRAKKLVIWMIAARDLHLSRTDAIANQVEWKTVTFNSNRSNPESPSIPAGTGNETVIEATAEAISKYPADPTKSTYADAVYCVKYRVDSVKSGKLEAKELFVFHWLFKKRQFLPTAEVKVGKRYELKLRAWADDLEAFSKTQLDDFEELETYYSETATLLP